MSINLNKVQATGIYKFLARKRLYIGKAKDLKRVSHTLVNLIKIENIQQNLTDRVETYN